MAKDLVIPEGYWEISSIEYKGKTYTPSAGILFTDDINHFSAGQSGKAVSGDAGVNLFHGYVQFKKDKMIFEDVAITKMAGKPEDMDAEDCFIRCINAKPSFKIAGDTMTLKAKGVKVTLKKNKIKEDLKESFNSLGDSIGKGLDSLFNKN